MTNKQQTVRGSLLVIAGSLVLLALSTWAMVEQAKADSRGVCDTREVGHVAIHR